MIHIGGYPGRYAPLAKIELSREPAQLFITGHSHILKIQFDDQLQCLHMNPGAAGRHGWHHLRTLIRFSIDGGDMKDCEVVELGKR
jgi:predicted phosphodiesterase